MAPLPRRRTRSKHRTISSLPRGGCCSSRASGPSRRPPPPRALPAAAAGRKKLLRRWRRRSVLPRHRRAVSPGGADAGKNKVGKSAGVSP
uniref:Uncharacterized protein n=1 Tax=Arundo donax TaxID=35708 RepID=A0A0A8YBG4_ARUDO